ncbi:MAG: UDP-N-acetylmuramate dehydrogenase [Oscillospiraceae bacterium]
MTDTLVKEVSQKIPGLAVRSGEPMKNHCSFRIGGPARAMAFPKSERDMDGLLCFLHEKGERPLIIGNGTNLLIPDAGTKRFVIKLGEGFDEVEQADGEHLLAQSGITLARLAVRARELSLAGLEFAHGIPGSLGGAVYMNAGAYGGEMKDVLESVTYIDGETRKIERREAADLDFSYRHSFFSGREDIILSAVLRLEHGDEDVIAEKMRELAEKRRSSQPLDKPSAGSTFKRPKRGYAAALIDECGLKGYMVGGAQVSPKHAGFIVNNGGASFLDVLRLMAHIEETVLREKGVVLEPEVKIITD